MASEAPKICGILGTGNVGQALTLGYIRLGYRVAMGTRPTSEEEHAAKQAKIVESMKGRAEYNGEDLENCFELLSFSDAAAKAQLVILAFGWDHQETILGQIAEHTAGKIVIDALNPLTFASGGPGLAVAGDNSAGEMMQAAMPDAHVVKAYNIITNTYMCNAGVQEFGEPGTMWICGNNADAKAEVKSQLVAFGWNVVDSGGIEKSRYIEPLAMIWIDFAAMNGWRSTHMIKMIIKEP